MEEQDRSRILAAELNREIPKFDTHGLFPDEVETRIDQFLFEYFRDPLADSVRIVYGIGEGKMKKKVIEFLEKHPLVGEVKDEGASCIVVFDRD